MAETDFNNKPVKNKKNKELHKSHSSVPFFSSGECVMQPQKLEVNFNPDGRYHPMFYDHMCSVTQIL